MVELMKWQPGRTLICRICLVPAKSFGEYWKKVSLQYYDRRPDGRILKIL